MILQGMIGQLSNYKVNHLHNLETITHHRECYCQQVGSITTLGMIHGYFQPIPSPSSSLLSDIHTYTPVTSCIGCALLLTEWSLY